MQELDPRDKLSAFPTAAVPCRTAAARAYWAVKAFLTQEKTYKLESTACGMMSQRRTCARYAQVLKVHGEALSPSKLAPRSPQEIPKYKPFQLWSPHSLPNCKLVCLPQKAL